jgi:hypothetical protein
MMEERTMEPILTPAADLDHDTEEDVLVSAWRAEQLWRLGLPRVLAEAFADLVDWHALAKLVERGCSPELALEIVR